MNASIDTVEFEGLSLDGTDRDFTGIGAIGDLSVADILGRGTLPQKMVRHS